MGGGNANHPRHSAEGPGWSAELEPERGGQPRRYPRNQILLFKQDRRSPGDEALKQMKTLMRSVPDSAVADLAAHYSSLEVSGPSDIRPIQHVAGPTRQEYDRRHHRRAGRIS